MSILSPCPLPYTYAMWKILLLLLPLFPLSAYADLVLGIGASVTSRYETRQENAAGDDLLDLGGGLGLGVDLELMMSKRFSLNMTGVYRREDAVTQYRNDIFIVPNLDTTATTVAASLGPRFRLLDFNRLRLFLGGGLTAGSLTLSYDKSDYRRIMGSDNGFKHEGHGFSGYYYEGGLELIFHRDKALRLSARETRYRTQRFETIGGTMLDVSQTQFHFQLLQYIDF